MTETNIPQTFQVPNLVQAYINEVAIPNNLNVEFILKSQSKLMKAVGWIFKTLRFNQSFMSNYFTTLGHTIYLPDSINNISEQRLLEVVSHEIFHMSDEKRLSKPLYLFLYSSPQILSLLTLLAFINPWFLLCLLFLAPIPSPGRFYLELRAYRTSILWIKETQTDRVQDRLNLTNSWISDQLTKQFYYFCWPFKSHVNSLLNNHEFLTNDPAYQPIKQFIHNHNMKQT